MLLALDTSTSAITVALHDGHDVVARRSLLDARAHAELLAPLVREVLGAAGRGVGDLTGVAVGTGPGPFTGLRVGIVTARTLALALDIPVYGVCSLDAIAHEAAVLADGVLGGAGELLVATDARRKEVYWARYAASGERLTDPAVTRPADLPDDVRALPTAGRGPLLYPELLPHALSVLDVDAGALAALAVARLAVGQDLSSTEPLYLRRPDAVPSVTAKVVL